MITPKDYRDAMEARLKGKFPGEEVYRDLVPEDFTRPSNEIECVSFSAAATGAAAVNVEVKMLIRTFVAVDNYHNSHFDDLYSRAMTILGLFVEGWINVSDSDTGVQRAPKVTAMAVPVTGKDYAEIHLTFSMQICKSDFGDATESPAPPMLQATITKTIKEGS